MIMTLWEKKIMILMNNDSKYFWSFWLNNTLYFKIYIKNVILKMFVITVILEMFWINVFHNSITQNILC